jgi:hypothetical protein
LSPPLIEEAILTVFENRQMKRIFGQKAEKIAEEYSKFRKESSQFISIHQIVWRSHQRLYEINRTSIFHAGDRPCTSVLHCKGRVHLMDPSLKARIILKSLQRNRMLGDVKWIKLRQKRLKWLNDHHNELYIFIKD